MWHNQQRLRDVSCRYWLHPWRCYNLRQQPLCGVRWGLWLHQRVLLLGRKVYASSLHWSHVHHQRLVHIWYLHLQCLCLSSIWKKKRNWPKFGTKFVWIFEENKYRHHKISPSERPRFPQNRSRTIASASASLKSKLGLRLTFRKTNKLHWVHWAPFRLHNFETERV